MNKLALTYFVFMAILMSAKISFAQDTIVVKVISKSEGRAIPGCTIEIEGYPGDLTDNNGQIKVAGLTKGKHKFKLFKSRYLTIFDKEIEVKNEIVIIKLSETTSTNDGISPVQTITLDQIQRSPHLNLSQLLNAYVPSFHAVPQTIADLSDHIVPSAMKGLSPDQFLVLVDKHRRHTSSVVNVNRSIGRGGVSNDLNSIPMSMIEEIEIFQTSASVRYGSDAIAGIINIKLKGQLGETKKPIVSFSSHFGNPLGGKYADRQDGQGRQVNFSILMPLGTNQEAGSLLVGGEYTFLGALNRSGSYDDPSNGIYFFNNKLRDEAKIKERNFWQQTGLYGRTLLEAGRAETADKSGFFKLLMPLNQEDAEFFVNGHINQRLGSSTGFYRLPRETSRIDTTLYPNGFSPLIQPIVTDAYVSSGIRGVINKKLNYDFAMTSSNNSVVVNLNNTINASLGNASPTSFYAGKFNYSQHVIELNASRAISIIDFRAGVLFRRENYQISAGEPASYISGKVPNTDPGSQVFPGLSIENQIQEYRNNLGGYLEGDLEIGGFFSLKFGGRGEIYTGRGLPKQFGQISGMGSIAYNSSDNKITMSFSYNGGFKAPSLAQTFFTSSSTQTTAGIPVRVFTANSTNDIKGLLGFEALEPEIAHTFNYYLKFKHKKTDIAFNTYYIFINDRIALSGQLNQKAAEQNASLKSILNSSNFSALQVFLNAARTNTFGIEGSFSQQVYAGNKAQFTPSISYFINLLNSVKKLEGDTIPDLSKIPSSLAPLSSFIFNKEDISRLEFQQPKFKVLIDLPLTGHIGKSNTQYEALARFSVIGNVIYRSPGNENSSQDQNYSAVPLLDLRFSIMPNQGKLSIFAGCNNLFDTFPNENQGINRDFNRFLYSRRSPQFDLTGRYFYTGLRLNL